MSLPVIRVVNSSLPVNRQQAVMVCTSEARGYSQKRLVFPSPPEPLLVEASALNTARLALISAGVPAPSRIHCLGRMVLPFGKYINASFHWLAENDVGYLVYLMDKHTEESKGWHSTKMRAGWLKDLLLEYARSFPQIHNMLAENVDRCIYGQKGFEDRTFEEMHELYQTYAVLKANPSHFTEKEARRVKTAYASVCRWVNTPLTKISSVLMKNFQKYILAKQKQSHSTLTSSSAPSTSTASASWDGDEQSDKEMAAMCQSVEESLQSSGRQDTPGCFQIGNSVQSQSPESVTVVSSSQSRSSSSRPRQSTFFKGHSSQPIKPSSSMGLPESRKPMPSKHQFPLPQSPGCRSPASDIPQLKKTISAPTHPSQSRQPTPIKNQLPPSDATLPSQPTRSQPDPSVAPVELEGWVISWEKQGGIPAADVQWLKEDTERGLFPLVHTYKDNAGRLKRRRVMRSDQMWFYPPDSPGFIGNVVPTAGTFFRSRVFVWRPVGVWRCSLVCPRGDQCVGAGTNVHLTKSGYHHRVRHICDVKGWYTMITEVLCCGPCTKAARNKEGVSVGRWLAWDSAILSQLSAAHQAFFPAVLTSKRGVDKAVVKLLRDRTEGNTMSKLWRQIQEIHNDTYLHNEDMYLELLEPLLDKGSIVSALGHKFQPPPPQRELPSARLIRHAFLLSEAENVQDYRSQILSTFGSVMKMDSTKKVVKKLRGDGQRTAEWFTSIGNEFSQIVSFVLTCEESTEKLTPMCQGVMERFRLANQPAPKILYVDRGCCRSQGAPAVENLFQAWVDRGMVVRLDIFHWIHRFDAAIRSESHSKYAAFKSALAGALLAFNREDMELLVSAVRGKNVALKNLTSEEIIRDHISKDQLKHHVRRVTQGAQETFRLVQEAIDDFKGPAGLDQSGVALFKSEGAIDQVWANQQRHLECIQDPPEMAMYRLARTSTINKVDVPFYKCLRGSNSLEGFHRSLPHMIPGPHCAARPYQVYLISGIARWNSDRSSDAVFGGKGRQLRCYSAPLIDRLNLRSKRHFNKTVEENFRLPAAVNSKELLGLEYLFSQSSGEAFSLKGLENDGPTEEEEVIQPDQLDPDEAYASDTEDPVLDVAPSRIIVTSRETSKSQPPAFEDLCSQSPLPGFKKLEDFCTALVDLVKVEEKLSLTTEQRSNIVALWNAVEDHDKQPQRFNQLYQRHWGNSLYCRTKRDSLEDAAIVQRLKMAKRYAPAQQDISAENNRLMYTLVKLLWLWSPTSSPEKVSILKYYERIQHIILVEDSVLSKAGIPLPKINSKTVRDFIHRQEKLLNLRATKQPTVISKTSSISSAVLPPAPRQPDVLPAPDYPVVEFKPILSTAGTKQLKERKDISVLQPVQTTAPHLPPAPPCRCGPPGVSPLLSDTDSPGASSMVSTSAKTAQPTSSQPKATSSFILLTSTSIFAPPLKSPKLTTSYISAPRLAPKPTSSSHTASALVPASSVIAPLLAHASASSLSLSLHRPPAYVRILPTPLTLPADTFHSVAVSPTLSSLPSTSIQALQPSFALSLPSAQVSKPAESSTQVSATATSSQEQRAETTFAAPAPDTQQRSEVTWSRSTHYRRKRKSQDIADIDGKVSRVHNLPVCKVCGQPLQGHKKYKKRNFCPVKMMSTAQGMDPAKVYESFEEFQRDVDKL